MFPSKTPWIIHREYSSLWKHRKVRILFRILSCTCLHWAHPDPVIWYHWYPLPWKFLHPQNGIARLSNALFNNRVFLNHIVTDLHWQIRSHQGMDEWGFIKKLPWIIIANTKQKRNNYGQPNNLTYLRQHRGIIRSHENN